MEEENMETNTIKASAKRYDEQFKKDTVDDLPPKEWTVHFTLWRKKTMETNTIKASAKRYDEQFKKDAVDYWIKKKKLAKEVSEAFEVSETTLYK